MRDHRALDLDVQRLKKAMQLLEDLGDNITEEGHELRAECNALMGRLTWLRNGRGDKAEAEFVAKRVENVHRAVLRRVSRLRLVRPPYSPVDPSEGSGAPPAA